jgi:hypothetical protein
VRSRFEADLCPESLDFFEWFISEGCIPFGDAKRILPLQAADYFAYENFRYLNGTVYGKDPVRWQYAAVKKAVADGRLFDKTELETLLREMNW